MSNDLKTFGIPQRARLLDVPSAWFVNWPNLATIPLWSDMCSDGKTTEIQV